MVARCRLGCARPTGDRYGRTTAEPAQAKGRAGKPKRGSSAAREKTRKGPRGDPLRSFTRIDPSSKREVTRPKAKGRSPVGPRPGALLLLGRGHVRAAPLGGLLETNA